MSWRNALSLPWSAREFANGDSPIRALLDGAGTAFPPAAGSMALALPGHRMAARLIRYLLRFPLWEDEAMLSANYLDRGYLDLLRPLGYLQVTPTLFLWGQLTVVKLLGFSEYTLRLIPLVCSIASLFLFRRLAGLLLRGTALVATFGLFAVAYPPIRYAAEAKPYGCDLFLALLMLWMLVRWLRSPGETRWLWGLAAVIAPAVGYSYPAVFVGGGVSLIVGYILWTAGRPGTVPFARSRGWLPWIVFNLLMVGSFLAVLFVSRTAVGTMNQVLHAELLADRLPAAGSPLATARLVRQHARRQHDGLSAGRPGRRQHALVPPGRGGAGGAGGATAAAAPGRVVLPLGLNFVAAALHRFPYGEHMRFTLYSATTFCVLIALGATVLVSWLTRRRPQSTGVFAAVLVVLVLIGCGSILRDVTHPYKSDLTLRSRDFAQWFWFDLAHESELVCLHTDLKTNFTPKTFAFGWSALYLCNQRIYSPRHARGEPPHLERVSAQRPLRCVLFRDKEQDPDTTAVDRWLAEMQRHYKLVSRDTWEMPIYGKWNAPPESIQNYLEVFKFVPLGGKEGENIANRSASPAPAAGAVR